MAPGDSDEATSKVGRRALLGGAIGVAAAGFVGYEAGARSTEEADADAVSTATPEASAVTVAPEGELVAHDVQTALSSVYDRTSALARLQDLRVAYELLDDFPPAGGDRVGTLGWQAVVAGAGAAVDAAVAGEGGLVHLTPGTTAGGRVGLHLGLDQQVGAPVFTMEWRLALDRMPKGGATTVSFGALSSVSVAAGEQSATAIGFFVDPATGPTWQCRCATEGTETVVDTGRGAGSQFQRFAITSDGSGLIRFFQDDAEVAAIDTDLPTDDARYGHGIQIAHAGGAEPVGVTVDWFYLRRELPR